MHARSVSLAAASLAALLGLAGPGAAQVAMQEPGPLIVRPRAAPDEPAVILVSPAVEGSAFGLSGYGYYYDGPGEGPLPRWPRASRAAYGRAPR